MCFGEKTGRSAFLAGKDAVRWDVSIAKHQGDADCDSSRRTDIQANIANVPAAGSQSY